MRALCGAIIACGAFIGLGLTAIGIGQRYSMDQPLTAEKEPILVKLSQMDRPLVFILVFLTCGAMIGMGIAFVGLAYHHLRRDREHLWERERHGPQRGDHGQPRGS
ncbi:MAG TPA: hypothetical protein VKE40_03360 [Gemmataceae bacterium]|nr:hypothetical protein [Gemmataceae bacterium]